MKLLPTVRLGAFILIFLNLLMAYGSIWIFTRMAPAIEVIINRNESSLEASEQMLSALAMAPPGQPAAAPLLARFEDALAIARTNITEDDEPEVITTINRLYRRALTGDNDARAGTIESINRLSEINRAAMIRADKRARQLGNGGAWGVVFMASFVFLAALLFIKTLERTLVRPLEEINRVITDFRRGNTARRCFGTGRPKDIQTLFQTLNALLDTLQFKRQV